MKYLYNFIVIYLYERYRFIDPIDQSFSMRSIINLTLFLWWYQTVLVTIRFCKNGYLTLFQFLYFTVVHNVSLVKNLSVAMYTACVFCKTINAFANWMYVFLIQHIFSQFSVMVGEQTLIKSIYVYISETRECKYKFQTMYIHVYALWKNNIET